MKRSAEAIWVEARNRWQINVQKDGKRKNFTSSLPGRKGKHEAELKADEWLESQTEDRRFGSAVEHVDLRLNRRGFCVDGVEPGGVRLAFADGGGIVSHGVQVAGQDFAA